MGNIKNKTKFSGWPNETNTFRRLTRDMEIAGKKLRAGNSVMMPICQLRDNTTVYGTIQTVS
jgi:cytochrome P450